MLTNQCSTVGEIAKCPLHGAKTDAHGGCEVLFGRDLVAGLKVTVGYCLKDSFTYADVLGQICIDLLNVIRDQYIDLQLVSELMIGLSIAYFIHSSFHYLFLLLVAYIILTHLHPVNSYYMRLLHNPYFGKNLKIHH